MLDTEKLNRWLALGANVGVLVGIVFLAVEIRQNTDMTRAQITQSRAEAAMSLADSSYNSEYIPDIWIKSQEGEPLTAAENFRFRVWLRASLRNQDNNFQQYKQGLLGDHIPELVSRVVRTTIASSPSGREYWEGAKFGYSVEFIKYVDSVIAEIDRGTD